MTTNDPVTYGLCVGCGVLRRPVYCLLLRHEGDDVMNYWYRTQWVKAGALIDNLADIAKCTRRDRLAEKYKAHDLTLEEWCEMRAWISPIARIFECAGGHDDEPEYYGPDSIPDEVTWSDDRRWCEVKTHIPERIMKYVHHIKDYSVVNVQYYKDCTTPSKLRMGKFCFQRNRKVSK